MVFDNSMCYSILNRILKLAELCCHDTMIYGNSKCTLGCIAPDYLFQSFAKL